MEKYSGKYVQCDQCHTIRPIEEHEGNDLTCPFCNTLTLKIIDKNVKGYDGVQSEFRIEETKGFLSHRKEYQLKEYNGSAKVVVIPDFVTDIDPFVFSHNENIEKVVLPDSITSIGYAAFSDCKNLRTVHFPSGLQYIDEQAFSGCVSLSNVSLPLHVRVETDSFFECDTLQKEWEHNGGCPYCGTKLKRKFFSKICQRCGIKF